MKTTRGNKLTGEEIMKVIRWTIELVPPHVREYIQNKTKEAIHEVKNLSKRDLFVIGVSIALHTGGALLLSGGSYGLAYYGYITIKSAKSYTFIASVGSAIAMIITAPNYVRDDRMKQIERAKHKELSSKILERSEQAMKNTIERTKRAVSEIRVKPKASQMLQFLPIHLYTNWEKHPRYHEFICPITKDVIMEGVRAADGKVYEREALESWYIRGHDFCPSDPSKSLSDPSLMPTDEATAELVLEAVHMQFPGFQLNQTRQPKLATENLKRVGSHANKVHSHTL